MKQADQIEIPLNKKIVLLLFLFFAVFAVFFISFCIAIATDFFEDVVFIRSGGPEVTFVIVFLGVILCGAAAIALLRSLFSKKPALTINSKGVTGSIVGTTINASWSDITEIRSVKVEKHRYLVLFIKNPQNYIDKTTNILERKGLQNNYDTHGSPVVIPNSLKIDFDHLHQLLLEKMKEYKQQ